VKIGWVRWLLAVGLAVVFSCGGGGGGGGGGGDFLVGAHYYVWYPSNFSQGFLRAALRPAQEPEQGRYDSRSPAVAEQHIAAATAHGVDFFAVDWWPTRPGQNAAIDSGLLQAANIGQIRFCITYNTSAFAGAPGQGIVFDGATANRFVTDLTTIARRYFGHPSYLRVDGRPVIIVYLTREIRGLLPQAMADMRQALGAEGYDPFVIGDEIYWAAIEANEDPSAPARIVGEPQVSRARLFDAITGYNLYAVERPQDRGYGSQSAFIGDSAAIYGRYRADTGVPIVPGIIPGYNDRGTRLSVDHFAIPRRFSPDAAEGSFFAEEIDRIAKPFADGSLRMVLVTSWNEWNEDTAIEPVTPAPATTDDAGGGVYTQGFPYEGFGNTYLDLIRDQLG